MLASTLMLPSTSRPCYYLHMMEEAQQVLEAALKLGPEERAVLTDSLLNSLAEHDLDAEWSHAWAAEAARRAEEIESGSIKSVPWDVHRDRLASRLDVESHD